MASLRSFPLSMANISWYGHLRTFLLQEGKQQKPPPSFLKCIHPTHLTHRHSLHQQSVHLEFWGGTTMSRLQKKGESSSPAFRWSRQPGGSSLAPFLDFTHPPARPLLTSKLSVTRICARRQRWKKRQIFNSGEYLFGGSQYAWKSDQITNHLALMPYSPGLDRKWEKKRGIVIPSSLNFCTWNPEHETTSRINDGRKI